MSTTTTTATTARKRTTKAATKATTATPDATGRFGSIEQAARETIAAHDAVAHHVGLVADHRAGAFVSYAVALGRAVALRPAGSTHADLSAAIKAIRETITGVDKASLSKADAVWTHVVSKVPADDRDAYARRWHAAGATKAKAYAAAVAIRDGKLAHGDVIDATKADTIPAAAKAQGTTTKGPRTGKDRNPAGQARAATTAGEDAAGSALATQLGATYAETVAVALALLGSARAAAKAAKVPHGTLAEVRAFGIDALAKATAPKRTPKA